MQFWAHAHDRTGYLTFGHAEDGCALHPYLAMRVKRRPLHHGSSTASAIIQNSTSHRGKGDPVVRYYATLV
ncbi:hypothetical protein GT037_006215 [Alternaria burnsii]|uniref:Uncharacterized protein n=1 Tax=Alternaria burnsii TaxID=1187904 RepID=A0A8H7EF64_9PLEO|nr:uncharacterized protein GT037_006215 [Alternaria burnsii]KAF7675496.1 hypothetical protein GT037_006215 [Alternaria burnsii]